MKAEAWLSVAKWYATDRKSAKKPHRKFREIEGVPRSDVNGSVKERGFAVRTEAQNRQCLQGDDAGLEVVHGL
jgi:hypothetical protein